MPGRPAPVEPVPLHAVPAAPSAPEVPPAPGLLFEPPPSGGLPAMPPPAVEPRATQPPSATKPPPAAPALPATAPEPIPAAVADPSPWQAQGAPAGWPDLSSWASVGMLAGPAVEIDAVQMVPPADLRRACELLRDDVAALTLPLELPEVETARRELESLLTQLDDYLLPRLRRIDAPLLAVVGGSTGAGKSTLVNSLVRRLVTRSGVLRPTTRSPVLVHHPYDSGAFLTQRILPGFARVTSEAPEPAQPIEVDAPRVTALRLVPDEGLPPGLAIVDAPDVDSLVETNRDLAVQLLSAADLWIFVTTAARYADAVPWDMLRTAAERGVSVAVVLDRVPVEAMTDVRVHLATMLRDRDLSTSPLFTIPEMDRDQDGFLPLEAVAPLHGWLSQLARDARSRDVVVRRTLVGALASLHERVKVIASAAEDQVSARGILADQAARAFARAEEQLAVTLRDGALLRGEVLARWREYVGSGEVFRGLDGSSGKLSYRLGAVFRSRPASSAALSLALRTGLQAAVLTAAQAAIEAGVQRWRQQPAGCALLDATKPETTEAPALSPGFEQRVADVVQNWQAGVVQRARAESRQGGHGARSAAAAERSGVVLMLLALSLDRRDLPPVALAEQVLRVGFGDSLESLADSVLADLLSRLSRLLNAERRRFDDLLDGAGVRDDLAVAMRTHLRAIERAR